MPSNTKIPKLISDIFDQFYSSIHCMFTRKHLRDGDKQRSKSNPRKKLISPIRIKDKIKQLQEKVEKQAIVKETIKKHMRHQKQFQGSIKNEQLSPFKKLEKIRPEFYSSDKHVNSLFSASKQHLSSKKMSEKQQKDGVGKSIKILRRKSQRDLPSMIKQNKQEQSLQQLKHENEKYKQIFNKSQEKMKELQEILNQIKGKHQSEKYTLQRKIDNLQKKIEEKKINLAHLYTYDQKGNNFLIIEDKIIAQTDNQNSSSPQATSKKNSNLIRLKPTPQFSNLSLQSK